MGDQPGQLPRRAQVLSTLIAANGCVVDSSPMYGTAEQVVGDALKASNSREMAFIATKVWTQGREQGIAQMERSMALLYTSHIELMQIHNLLDWRTHLRTLTEWKEAGRISYIGATHYAEEGHAALEEIMRTQPIDFVQFNYSVASRQAERRLLALATERGIAVIINLPFGGGRLLQTLHKRRLPEWAAQIGCTSWGQLMLKFVLSQPAVTCVIPGTSSPDHMSENAAAGWGVPPEPDFWKNRMNVFAV